MTDLLYILGNGSKHDNQELRWSLRSIERHGVNVGRVVIVGDVPEWVSGEAVTLRTDHHARLVQKNIWGNVAAAVSAGLVKGRFMLQADDHFYVKDVDFDAHPTYVCGELPYAVEPDEPHYEYKLGLVGSRWLMGRYAMPTRMTSNHNALTVDAGSFSRHPGVVQACRQPECRMNAWAVLGNMYLNDHPDAPVGRREDMKLFEPVDSAEFDRILASTDMFSVDDAMFGCEAFTAYMECEFGKKSRWEK